MSADFVVYPAIDLRKGRCVRLRQGDPAAETVYDEDPVAVARRWVAEGARWLHVVNLDGAIGDEERTGELPLNLRVLAAIREAVPVPIQFGGGLRSLDDVRRVLDLGATRVILGTVALTHPALVEEAIRRFGPERVVVGLDARDGRVASHGWQQVSDMSAVALGRAMYRVGVRYALFTDVRRDGMLTGVNVDETVRLAEATGLKVIASGGVATLEDIRRLLAVRSRGVVGVVIGQALYTGRIHLPQVMALVEGASSSG